jgi:radical SAM superfamily enzyme YgiQ (UPF0313 family)
MAATRVLIVRLPCHKVFPTGPIYLLSLIGRAAPLTEKRLLDLAVIERRRQWRVLQSAIDDFHPDCIAFSWRDMQIFSPNYLDSAMRDAFTFFHDPRVIRKAGAAFRGLADIATFHSTISRIIDLLRKTAARNPTVDLALGGPSIRIFGDRLRARLPKKIHVFTETTLDGFFRLLGVTAPTNPVEPSIDHDSLRATFPQWEAYRDETVGIQTKVGCPQRCLYCLYGHLEGTRVRRREPARVVEEMAGYVRLWGTRRFWFADAQLLSEPEDRAHLTRILEGLVAAKLDVGWSGYLRIHELDSSLASLMVRSGMCDLEVSLNSGAQSILDGLQLGFTVEEVMQGFEVLLQAGYAGKVYVNLSLNAPGETRETLLATVEVVRQIRSIFGMDRVIPVVFFLAIQPHTGLEKKALADGSLKTGYDPLSVLPWDVIKLIYNPPPLGRLIGTAFVRALDGNDDDVGGRVLAGVEAGLGSRGARAAVPDRRNKW